MPITKSAKKALRQSETRRKLNEKRKHVYRTAVKGLRKLLVQKKFDEAKAALPKVFKALDKTAKTGVLKKNAADRLKSRLAQAINRSTKVSS